MLSKLIEFFLDNKLVVLLFTITISVWGLSTAPFDWSGSFIPKDPVAVDAIPDLGENQQIVQTEWPGRSPQDIEDQITFPLTTQLLSVPGVKTVRSTSMLGLSSIYVIFEENVEFYWSRSRILEKLNALPVGLLPVDTKPMLGPDATGLGQIFWYTLEGRDENGKPAGGWDPQELRSIQDFYVNYALGSVEGVAEVASVGGYVKEYQIELDPEALHLFGVTVAQVAEAVKASNRDVGARTLEINQVEYVVRGLGYVKSLQDLESIVLKTVDRTPVLLKHIANIQVGPAQQRGYLDKSGAVATGGVVVARYGANPMQVIEQLNQKIAEISPGLPVKTLENGTLSKVTIVPFYDRSGLIKETLATLEDALILQVLVTLIVVILLLFNTRASLVVTGLLPMAVLSVFIAMRYFGVDANIVALSGIAIAIGTMVDMGIILTESILQRKEEMALESWREVIFKASKEVGSAIVTAVSTTIVSFIPVFTMIGAEGKLFKPLAFTKTFALISSILIALFVLPAFAQFVLGFNIKQHHKKAIVQVLLAIGAMLVMYYGYLVVGIILFLLVLNVGLSTFWVGYPQKWATWIQSVGLSLVIAYVLADKWLPLGASNSLFINMIFVLFIILTLLGSFYGFMQYYKSLLTHALNHPFQFLLIPSIVILLGLLIWIGVAGIVRPMGIEPSNSAITQKMQELFPGLGKEFMPSLDEGSFLLMPTVMPHVGIEEAREYLEFLDKAVTAIPEVESVVGKMGRINSALDPAPISMDEK